ncbi:MAG: hypothetical protein RI556_13045 [Hydrogenovibrio sp.]|uniref:hypothetical protein n=1 Tax=Hydrogenovibrio sp. TaxID=2065821 RepID=UPI0028708959|nr:hypothetical protein [Hydrogenovibrio sp.]MDR9500097.1 hypothetical protein [Hydrogenovibrio sp.]
MNRRQFLLGSATGLSMTSFTGCGMLEAIENTAAKNRLESLSLLRAKDPEMVDAFYRLSNGGKNIVLPQAVKHENFYVDDINAFNIVFKKRLFHATNMPEMNRTMHQYLYASETDALSRTFISAAKNRGNQVKLFRPRLTKRVNQIYAKPFEPTEHSREWYGRDPFMMEFEDDRPKSFMVRAHQVQTSLAVRSYLYSSIFIGDEAMRVFENQMGNFYLNDAFITNL